MDALGKRERNKVLRREHIADTARELFLERGFDAVTVAEVARQAGVVEKTVFNYFPRKEDLFYGYLEAFENDLVAAIRKRGAGESIIGAFAAFVLQPRGLLARGDAAPKIRRIAEVISGSPPLLRREQEVLARFTETLADLIDDELGTTRFEAWVIANALMGVHRSLIEHVRERTLAGIGNRQLAVEVEALGRLAFTRLERGLAGLGAS